MDQLRRSLFRALLGDDWTHGVEPAVDIALLGRYYERIADHAVSIARRVVFLVTGESPVGRLTAGLVVHDHGFPRCRGTARSRSVQFQQGEAPRR